MMNVATLFKQHTKAVSGIMACLIVLAGSFAMPLATAQAADEPAPPAQDGDYPRLSLFYERVQLAYESQSYRLDLAHRSAELTQEWIDLLADEGHDTSDLEAALAGFNSLIDEAEGYHDEAGAILENPAGFDADWNVTDRAQAIDTLREAGRALRDSHRSLVDGTITLRRAIQDFRQEMLPDQMGE
jgi:hypothetical protein